MEQPRDYPAIEETLFKLNGTLMAEGQHGKALALIADRLEKINWNLGTIAKNTSEIAARIGK